MIVAIEGIDGAGKNTLVGRLREALDVPVRVIAFPRYEVSIHAQLAREALYGRMGDMTQSSYAMATLFALDRFGAREDIAPRDGELVILDRYVASNAAYSSARLGGAEGNPEVVQWVYDLEYGRLELPHPDLQIFLDTDVALAAQRAAGRAAQDATRAKDEYEKDDALQAHTAAAYQRLAAAEWGGPWLVTSDADRVIEAMRALLGAGSEDTN